MLDINKNQLRARLHCKTRTSVQNISIIAGLDRDLDIKRISNEFAFNIWLNVIHFYYHNVSCIIKHNSVISLNYMNRNSFPCVVKDFLLDMSDFVFILCL